MTTRTVEVVVNANVSGLSSGLGSAGNQISGFASRAKTSFSQLSNEFKKNEQAARDLGRGMTVVGLGVVAGLGLAAKAAIDWESAWTGVLKTVDATPAQLGEIEQGLRGMSRELPASQREIAAVAEAAGQLGVEADSIVGFTRVMIDLGETTNLTADEAATAIAQLMNVMGTAPDQVSNLGSALVALGNNGASTEREIVFMAQRISGAAAIVGASEADVLALANALASVGINVEAGGSAISRVMIDMAESVEVGNEKLEIFAEVAGMSSQEFAAAFREDPIRAIDSFVQGLGEMNEAGGNVFGTLNDLGLSEIRVRDALLRLAASGDLLTESLDLGALAWAENNALAEEAGKRYDTTAAQIEIAKNNIVDAGISIGETLLPAISAAAGAVADLAGWFSDLPQPVQQTGAALAGVVGVASLVGGGFLLLFPRVMQTVDAFRSLQRTAPGVATWLGRIGRAAGVAGALFIVGEAITAIAHAGESGARGIEDTTRALLELRTAADDPAEAMEILDGLFSDLDNNLIIGGEGVSTFGEALDRVFDPSNWQRYSDFANEALTLGFGSGSKELENAREALENMDTALADMVTSGHGEEAAAIWEEIVKQAEAQGVSVEQLTEIFPQHEAALQNVANANELAADSAEGQAAAMEEQAAAAGLSVEELEAAQKALEEMISSWAESIASFVTPMETYLEMSQAVAEASAEASGSAEDSWEDFADSATVSLTDFIAELEKQVAAQDAWATNIGILATRVTEDVLGELIRWGPEGAPLVAQMVDATDEEIAKLNELIPQSLADTQTGIAEELVKWADVAKPIADAFGQETAAAIGAGIATGETTVAEALAGLNTTIDTSIPGEVIIDIGIDPHEFFGGLGEVRTDIAGLDSFVAAPEVDLNDSPFYGGLGDVNEDLSFLDGQRPTPEADLNTRPFDEGTAKATRDLNTLNKQRPTPQSNLDNRLLQQRRGEAVQSLNALQSRRPTPKANLDYSPLRNNTRNAQKTINSLRGKTVTAGADVNGRGAVDGLRKAVGQLYSKTITVTVVTKRVGGPLPKADGGFVGYASGGGVEHDFRYGGYNPFGTTSRADDVLALLSRGEYVVQAKYAGKYADLLESINRGQLPRYQSGGTVNPAAASEFELGNESRQFLRESLAAGTLQEGATLRLMVGSEVVFARIVRQGESQLQEIR